MWGAFKELLTIDESQWYETFPFFCGALFFLLELAVRFIRERRPLLSVKPLVYAFGEGVSLATIATYGPALVFNKQLALQIADKNAKIIVIALLIAFISITRHLIDGWADASDSHRP